jgi:putative transposase
LLTTRFLAFDLKVGRLTCFPVFGPIFAGKFQFSGMCDSGRWTRKDHEEIKVYGGADCLHPAAGWQVNPKRIYRLYREMGLQLRNKTPKRRVKAKLREDRQSATRPNETWAMDFVHDQLVSGRKLRVLTIIGTFSRFSPAIDVEILEEVGRQVGFPKAIRVDQGTEFVSRDLDLWAYQRGVTLDFSRPGKPTDNAFIESFNGKFRAECLNAHWFMSLDDARRKCEAWRRDYNEERPHSAIGNKAPIELIDRSVAYGPR